jgi:hypothetical protein
VAYIASNLAECFIFHALSLSRSAEGRYGVLPYREFHEAGFRRGHINLNHGTPYLPPMRSHEVTMPEANRLGPRLQPKRRGAAWVQGNSICFSGDPGGGVAKINRFGFVSRSFKQSVHIFLMPKKSGSGDNRLGGRGEKAR